MSDQPDWTEQARRLVAGLSGMLGQGAVGAGEQGEDLSGDCRWCPLCQAAAVLRGERPELTSAMADILTTAAAALRSFAGEAGESGESGEAGAASDVPAGSEETTDVPTEEGPAAEGPAVQRIEIA